MQIDPLSIWTFISDGGPPALLAVIIVSGLMRKWIFIWTHDLIVEQYKSQLTEVRNDRDRWQEAALKGTSLAREAVNTTTRAGGGS